MTKIRSDQMLTESELEKFMSNDCKLLTSKQLAKVLGVTDGALRKQRSKGRSIFPYALIHGRIFYPTDMIVKKIHNSMIGV